MPFCWFCHVAAEMCFTVGTLEMPYILEKGAKRERKKVERLEFQSPTEGEKTFEIKEGKGRCLGDIPFSKLQKCLSQAT